MIYPPEGSCRSIFARRINHSRFNDLDLVQRLVLRVSLDQTHSLDKLHSTFNSAKDCVFAVQPWCGRKGNEELASIGVGATVRHAEHTSASVFQRSMDFVLELLAIDGATAPASASGIAGLDHEVGDDAVKNNVVVVSSLGKGREVLAGLGRMIVVELDDDGTLLIVNTSS